jgi:Family of unknown function (DUF6492)
MADQLMPLCVYCKSYEGDVRRAVLLKQTVDRFNRDGLKFYVSVPTADRALFATHLGTSDIEYINDEDIARANPRVDPNRYIGWDGRLSQQVIKSEFWRLVPCNAYACVDSDCRFLRDFHASDFLHPSGHPYTLLDQEKELQQLAINLGRDKWVYELRAILQRAKERFGRTGPDYFFGSVPYIWSRKVWQDLDEKFLAPGGITLWEAIAEIPSESLWYGEALLKYESIPLYPIQPLFRIYHYDWQWRALRSAGETDENLAKNFLGVDYQSNWYRELDAGSKVRPLTSRMWRRVKRWLTRFQ